MYNFMICMYVYLLYILVAYLYPLHAEEGGTDRTTYMYIFLINIKSGLDVAIFVCLSVRQCDNLWLPNMVTIYFILTRRSSLV